MSCTVTHNETDNGPDVRAVAETRLPPRRNLIRPIGTLSAERPHKLGIGVCNLSARLSHPSKLLGGHEQKDPSKTTSKPSITTAKLMRILHAEALG
jgi:hypothetical protein